MTGKIAIFCVLAAGLALLAAAQPLGGGEGGAPGPPPAKVRIGTVKLEKLQARTDIVGRLKEVRRAVVAAERGGRIVTIDVEQGDSIIAGQSQLAKIDDILEKIALDQALAQLDAAKSAVTEANANLDLRKRHHVFLQGLQDQGSARPKEVQDAADAEGMARAIQARREANVRGSEGVVRHRREQLRRSQVIAPFNGFVVRKITELGQWVDEGDDVVEIISAGAIDANIDVPEWLINHVSKSEQIEVFIEPLALTVTGHVQSITPLGDNAARTFPVKIRFDDDRRGRLKAGMSVLAKIPANKIQDTLTVPRDAIHRSPAGHVIWLNLNQKAISVPVRILFGHKDRYAIQPSRRDQGPPIAPGMQVIVEGGERLLSPGQPLIITNEQVAASQ